jgi:hypothetical protein
MQARVLVLIVFSVIGSIGIPPESVHADQTISGDELPTVGSDDHRVMVAVAKCVDPAAANDTPALKLYSEKQGSRISVYSPSANVESRNERHPAEGVDVRFYVQTLKTPEDAQAFRVATQTGESPAKMVEWKEIGEPIDVTDQRGSYGHSVHAVLWAGRYRIGCNAIDADSSVSGRNHVGLARSGLAKLVAHLKEMKVIPETASTATR